MINKIDTTKNKTISAHILLAEDDLVNQEVTIEMLESIGCKVDVVKNGKELLDLMCQARFDLILINCQMLEMDGFQATTEIRHMESSVDTRIQIIAITANAMNGYNEKCLDMDMDMDMGMDDYLRKPFNQEQLNEILFRWV